MVYLVIPLSKVMPKKEDSYMGAVRELVNKYTHKFDIDVNWKNLAESDRVLAYPKELLSLGLLYQEYIDAIQEGDGLRILRC